MVQLSHPLVDKFFGAYMKHDIDGVRQVMDENAQWFFIGNHPLAGIKNGVDEIVAFFDKMNAIMAVSKPEVTKIITASDDDHFIECQHIRTNRPDGINVDHHAAVLWTFKNGKIVEGRHFFADGPAVDKYFSAVADK